MAKKEKLVIKSILERAMESRAEMLNRFNHGINALNFTTSDETKLLQDGDTVIRVDKVRKNWELRIFLAGQWELHSDNTTFDGRKLRKAKLSDSNQWYIFKKGMVFIYDALGNVRNSIFIGSKNMLLDIGIFDDDYAIIKYSISKKNLGKEAIKIIIYNLKKNEIAIKELPFKIFRYKIINKKLFIYNLKLDDNKSYDILHIEIITNKVNSNNVANKYILKYTKNEVKARCDTLYISQKLIAIRKKNKLTIYNNSKEIGKCKIKDDEYVVLKTDTIEFFSLTEQETFMRKNEKLDKKIERALS